MTTQIVELVSTLLREMGHESLALYHAKSALDAAPLFKPDLMLIDLSMPVTDGYQLARQLRAGDTTADLTLVAISGEADSARRQMAIDAGFDHFIAKPFGLDELRPLINEQG